MRQHAGAVRSVVAIALITIVVVAGCGDSAADTTATDPPGTITIEMGNFFFKPSAIKLKAGERVTLRFKNSSAMAHDFLVGRNVKGPESGYAEDLFKGVAVESSGGTWGPAYGGANRLELEALGSGQITFTVPNAPGTWEMGCFLPSHYQAGMKGTVTVE